MSMNRIMGGGGADEEIISLRFKSSGDAELKKAQAGLARIEAEVKDLNAAYDRGAVHADRYRERLKELTAEQERYARAAKEAQRLPGSSSAFYAARAGREAMRGNMMGAANNAFFAARSAGGVGGLVKQFGQLAIAGPGALAAIAAAAPVATTALVATGGALIAINQGLKSAELGWGDLTTVITNTGPWKAASEAISGTFTMVADSDVGLTVDYLYDGMKGIVNETANLAFGWDDATEATRRYNDEQAKAAEWTAKAAKGVEAFAKVQTDAEKKAKDQGAEFGKAFKDAGGPEALLSGMSEIEIKENSDLSEDEKVLRLKRRAEERERINALTGEALGGSTHAARQLIDLAEGRGLDARALRGAFGSQSVEVVGPDRKVMEEGLKAQSKRDAETDRLNAEAAKADEEARKVAIQTGFEANPGLEAEARRSLLDMIGGGMSAEDAAGTTREFMQDRLVAGGTPEKFAKEASREFVSGILDTERGKAVAAATDPAVLRMEQLGLMRSQLGLAEMMQGGPTPPPGVFDAGSFAQSVQASGKANDPVEQLKKMIGIQEAGIKLQEDIKRILERKGLFS